MIYLCCIKLQPKISILKKLVIFPTLLRIQILQILHDEQKFLLVNIYNENNEKNQIELLQKLDTQLSTYDCVEHNIIIGGDWNFILNKDLDAEGGSPQLKLSSIAELVKIKNKYNLIDIFRVRFPESKRFTYRQNSPRRLRRLDYFIVSNS